MDYLLKGLTDALALLLRLDTEVWIIVFTSLWVSALAVVVASLIGVPLGIATATSE